MTKMEFREHNRRARKIRKAICNVLSAIVVIVIFSMFVVYGYAANTDSRYFILIIPLFGFGLICDLVVMALTD